MDVLPSLAKFERSSSALSKTNSRTFRIVLKYKASLESKAGTAQEPCASRHCFWQQMCTLPQTYRELITVIRGHICRPPVTFWRSQAIPFTRCYVRVFITSATAVNSRFFKNHQEHSISFSISIARSAFIFVSAKLLTPALRTRWIIYWFYLATCRLNARRFFSTRPGTEHFIAIVTRFLTVRKKHPGENDFVLTISEKFTAENDANIRSDFGRNTRTNTANTQMLATNKCRAYNSNKTLQDHVPI